MNKNKYKVVLVLLSIIAIALGVGFTTSLKNMIKPEDKYDTISLIDNKEILNLEQMDELTRKTLIVCSTNFNIENSGAISVEQSGNIYMLTYDSSKEARQAYNKYVNDESVIFCELDSTLGTATLTPEELEYWGVECEDCENGDCDIHSIIVEHGTLSMEDFDWITNGTDTVVRVDGGFLIAGPTYSGHISNNVMQNLESNSSEDIDRKAVIIVLDSGANGNYTNGYNAITGTKDITDTNGHGTFVINTIESALAGCNNYEIIPIKIANDNGIASVSALVKGLEYIQNLNPTVVNISLNSLNNTKDEIIEGYLGKLYEKQVVTCVSAGNNGDDAGNYSPSKFATAIVVGSCDENGNRKEFSNYGASVDYNVVSNSTSEAAALTSALYAKAYLSEEYFMDVINNSDMYFTQKGNSISNIWNTGENHTDEAEYSTWYAGPGTKTLGTIPASSSPRKVTSVSAYLASGRTKGGSVPNIACQVAGCKSDKHDAYLGVWGTGPKYWYGSGVPFTASINLNGTAIGSVTVNHIADRTECGGPCDGDNIADEWGSVGGEDTHKYMTVTCATNTLAANTEGNITVTMPGTGGSWSSPGTMPSIRDTWDYTVESLHTCVYDQKNTNSKYLRTPQTCTQAETYFMSCTCGKYTGGSYFTNKNAAGHNYSSPYTYATNNGVANGVRYMYCNNTWNGTVCNTLLNSAFRHIVYVQYQQANGSYSAATTLVDTYYNVGATVSWSYSTDAAYNTSGLSKSYTVGTAAQSQTIKVPRKTYTQTVKVRYQNADGSWGAYSTVINTAYYHGSTVSWSRAADTTYKAASVSYTVTQANTVNVDVYRQTYLQKVYVRYENADGSWGAYSTVINTAYYHGSTVSWSRTADTTYKAASISYTVSAAGTKYVDVYRQTYNQVVQVRYENADGSFTSYSNAINTAYRYGATVSWSRAADAQYKAASISFTAGTGTTKQVTVYRQTYVQLVQIRYENADGTFTGYTPVVSGSYRYGQTISWSRAADTTYQAASLTTYTVTADKTTSINIMRNNFTFDLSGYIQGTNQSGFVKDGLTFGTVDVYINGTLVANDVSDYSNTDINYDSSIQITDIKAKTGYTYGGVKSGSIEFKLTSNSSTILIFDDKTSPVITLQSSHSNWTNQNITLTFSSTDTSGIVKMELIKDDSVVKTTTNGSSTTYTVNEDCNTYYIVKSYDRYGNTSESKILVQRDTVKPTILFDKHSGDWNTSHTISITVSDNASGINKSEHYFSENSSDTGAYDNEVSTLSYTVTKSDDGLWYLYCKATDNAGNTAVLKSTGVFKIDNTIPVIDSYTVEYNGDHVIISVNASDNISEIKGWACNTTGEKPSEWNTADLSITGTKASLVFRIDDAGKYYIFVKDSNNNVSVSISITLTTYTINYINNYGGNIDVFDKVDKIFVNSDFTTAKAPTNTTYTFKGWNTNDIGTGAVLNQNYEYNLSENFIENTLKHTMVAGDHNVLNIFGWWEKEYTLTLDLNGGTFESSKENIVLKGKFYNNITEYGFNVSGELTQSNVNYWDKQINSFNIYGELGVNGINKYIVKKSIDGTTYRLIGWSLNKDSKTPDNKLITYDSSHNIEYKVSKNTTLYAIWEPVLYIQVTGNRNLGLLVQSDVEGIPKIVTQASNTVVGKNYNGFITTIARPGEAVKYNLQHRGELTHIQVKFDPYITNMYDMKNPVYGDSLNKVDINSIHEAIPSEGYTEVNSSLNRLILNPAQSITRQFYLPQYLGSSISNEASHKSKNYYVDYIFTNEDSFYYEFVHNKDEVVTVRQYLVLADSNGNTNEIDSVLTDLRAKLKIRLR